MKTVFVPLKPYEQFNIINKIQLYFTVTLTASIQNKMLNHLGTQNMLCNLPNGIFFLEKKNIANKQHIPTYQYIKHGTVPLWEIITQCNLTPLTFAFFQVYYIMCGGENLLREFRIYCGAEKATMRPKPFEVAFI